MKGILLSEQSLDNLAVTAIEILQSYLKSQGLFAHIHFELEGCVSNSLQKKVSIDFAQINKKLSEKGIEGELVPEYWRNQWEYVSLFAGQSPLKEAHNLTQVINILPALFKQQGINNVLINPVVWSGDQAQLILGSKSIFQGLNKNIHIPNAIQINVSITDVQGKNLIADTPLGECLQQCFIDTSFACALLFLPEHDAYERLSLKSKYGLDDELCSPTDISGGHQGSIALYRQYGKHNQILGENILIVNHLNEPLVKQVNWQKTSRIEHRLGASSIHYNAYVNVVYALLNVIDAVEIYRKFNLENPGLSSLNQPWPSSMSKPLPSSLFDDKEGLGAYSYFKEDDWFEQRLNQIEQMMILNKNEQPLDSDFVIGIGIGSKIKNAILNKYQNKSIVLATSTQTDFN